MESRSAGDNSIIAAPYFYTSRVREGLESLLEGPPSGPSHPLHDPVLWLGEAREWIFTDSGLAEVLSAPDADELLGARLRASLVDLDQALVEASAIISGDIANARLRVAEPTRAVLENLDEGSPPAARTVGEPLG